MSIILKRIAKILLLFFGISGLAFLLIHLAPSDPAIVKLSNGNISFSPELLQQVREEMGLNQPLWIQYFQWLGEVLSGNFGVSLMSNQPITQTVGVAIVNTIQLALLSLVSSVSVSVVLAVYFARHQQRKVVTYLQKITLLGVAMPSFVVAYLLMYFFSVRNHIFPVLAVNGGVGLIMPVLTLLIPMSAKFIQQFSALLIDESQKEYVRVLYYRGIDEQTIYRKHVLKNTFPTVLTIVMLSFGSLLGGVVVVETIFYWPGIGKLLMDAIQNRDYPVVQVVVCLISFSYLAISTLTDWLNQRMDIRLKGRMAYE